MRIDNMGAPLPDTSGINRTKPAEEQFQQVLDKAVASGEDKKLKEAAKQFEALFMYQMFSQMRETVTKGGLTEESMDEKIFQGMFDQEISTKASETGGIGLAEMIYQQLSRERK